MAGTAFVGIGQGGGSTEPRWCKRCEKVFTDAKCDIAARRTGFFGTDKYTETADAIGKDGNVIGCDGGVRR